MTEYERNKKWRFKNPEKRYASKKKYYDKTRNARNKGSIWTQDELNMVLEHTMCDTELSDKIGRSVQAIQVMRWKLKNIPST